MIVIETPLKYAVGKPLSLRGILSCSLMGYLTYVKFGGKDTTFIFICKKIIFSTNFLFPNFAEIPYSRNQYQGIRSTSHIISF